MEAFFRTSVDPYKYRGRGERIARKTAAVLVGILGLMALGLGAKEGVSKVIEVENQYAASRQESLRPKSDLQLVKEIVLNSKYPDLKTGKGLNLPRLGGAIAVQERIYPADGKQMATLPNPWVIRLGNGHTYLYGENIMSEPVIWKAEEALLCTKQGQSVNLETMPMMHNMQGGMANRADTGAFIPNDPDWRAKCQVSVRLESLSLPVVI